MHVPHPRVALAGFAHNPNALVAPNGSILVFHIGVPLGPGCLANCTGVPGHKARPRPAGCASPNHGISVAIADRPEGPFRRFPYILERKSQPPPGPTDATNPGPMMLANGTIILSVRRARSTSQPLYRGHYTAITGPWELIPTRIVSTDAGTPKTFDQDPFLMQTPRGYHIISNRAVGGADNLCGGGHLFSRDLFTWYIGETVFGTGNQCSLELARRNGGSTSVLLTSRERPAIFADPASGARYIYTGAAINVSMYAHSFTLVQPLGPAPSASLAPPVATAAVET